MSDDAAVLNMTEMAQSFQLEPIECFVLGLFGATLLKHYNDPRITVELTTEIFAATWDVCSRARAEHSTIEAQCFLELRRRGIERRWPLHC